MSNLKLLIIGLGSIAKKHINALQSLKLYCCEIHALRSSHKSLPFKDVKDKYSWEEIDHDYDFIMLSNPTSEHLTTLEKVIDFGSPLFIEKPVLASLDGAKELLKKIKINNLKTYVACNLRFHDCIKFVKQLLESKKYGEIEEVNVYCGSYLPNWRPEVNFREIYSAIPELGGGVHLDLIHEIDYVYWLVGNPIESKSLLRNVSSLNIEAVDYANYQLIYPNFVANIVLNYYRRIPKRSLEIICTKGIIHADLIKNTVVENKKITFEKSDSDILYTYKNQMKFFLDYICTNRSTMNNFEEALSVLKICLDNESTKK